MSFYYNLKIQFCGTNYQGWQVQPNVPTVQGELNRSIATVFKSNEIQSIGSGRTDAGVHALDYLVKIKVPFSIVPMSLVNALNSNLPGDIRVIKAGLSSEVFLPTNHAISKEYLYRFSNLRSANAFQERFIPNVSYELNIDAMKKACKLFEGIHDFSDFQCSGSDVKTSVREIFSCDLSYREEVSLGGIYPAHYSFRVVGNGFLKQMVRLMVGTLWSVGRGKLELRELEDAMQKPKGKKLGVVVPASGLVKSKVTYESSVELTL